ncbi:hypothetical protein EVAR_81572_1 [Eumeta japonica]|uniref:Uncharacterized protein n=1 Tax=Eumeta variegata TaxID=151549 RepID=A0A4C1V0L6_EUMVA|nr:hypothetical protein EVAR_81572_1 [Eumeta japonica]
MRATKSRLLPLLINACNSRRVTNAYNHQVLLQLILATPECECLLDRNRLFVGKRKLTKERVVSWRGSAPPDLALTGRNTTAEAVTSSLYFVGIWLLTGRAGPSSCYHEVNHGMDAHIELDRPSRGRRSDHPRVVNQWILNIKRELTKPNERRPHEGRGLHFIGHTGVVIYHIPGHKF